MERISQYRRTMTLFAHATRSQGRVAAPMKDSQISVFWSGEIAETGTKVVRQSERKIPDSMPSRPGDRAENERQDHHALVIEPTLQRQSPENGNIRGTSRRLSPDSAHVPRNWEHRDRAPNGKRPPLAGSS